MKRTWPPFLWAYLARRAKSPLPLKSLSRPSRRCRTLFKFSRRARPRSRSTSKRSCPSRSSMSKIHTNHQKCSHRITCLTHRRVLRRLSKKLSKKMMSMWNSRRLNLILITVNKLHRSSSQSTTCSQASSRAAITHRCGRASNHKRGAAKQPPQLQLFRSSQSKKRSNNSDRNRRNERPRKRRRRRSEIRLRFMMAVMHRQRVRPK